MSELKCHLCRDTKTITIRNPLGALICQLPCRECKTVDITPIKNSSDESSGLSLTNPSNNEKCAKELSDLGIKKELATIVAFTKSIFLTKSKDVEVKVAYLPEYEDSGPPSVAVVIETDRFEEWHLKMRHTISRRWDEIASDHQGITVLFSYK